MVNCMYFYLCKNACSISHTVNHMYRNCVAAIGVMRFSAELRLRFFIYGVVKMSKAFGKHLRKLRKEKTDYSQQQMADILNIARSTYTYYETGKSEPSYDKLKILCSLFDIDTNTMLDYEE